MENAGRAQIPQKKRKSSSWAYFEQISDVKVKCKLCAKTFAYHSSTTGMNAHLTSNHADETAQRGPAALPQAPITSYTTTPRHCNERRANEISKLITTMIVTDMLPISFVEGSGFRELMAYVEPEYKVPCRTTITTRIEKMYEEKAEDLRTRLAAAPKVSITTDGWTALTTESYVTITCHYIDLRFEMQSAVLQTRAMAERHTAENLAEGLRSATESWGISNKVTACVHDNASNVTLANTRYLDWESSPCYAHTLQLAINDGFKLNDIQKVVAGASRLVSHFHHSTPATHALVEKQVGIVLHYY